MHYATEARINTLAAMAEMRRKAGKSPPPLSLAFPGMEWNADGIRDQILARGIFHGGKHLIVHGGKALLHALPRLLG